MRLINKHRVVSAAVALILAASQLLASGEARANAAGIPRLIATDIARYCRAANALETTINSHADGAVTARSLMVGASIQGEPTIDGFLYRTQGGRSYFQPLGARIYIPIMESKEIKNVDQLTLQLLVRHFLQDERYSCD